MYEYLIRNLILENNIKVKPFLNRLRGCAYPESRTIEIPYPNTKLRLSIALHEVGHIVLNHNNTKKRYIEEIEAWDYALKLMKLNNIPISNKLRLKRKKSINYAIGKAKRRGLKDRVSYMP